MNRYHTLVILITGSTMISAKSIGDIIDYLGGIPKNHSVRSIYSRDEVTHEQANEVAALYEFSNHINLITREV